MKTALTALAAVALTLAACSQPLIPADPTPAVVVSILPTQPPPSPTPAPDPIYLNLTWHQHQPPYATDPQTGLITQPWVRLNATRRYYDMAATLKRHPSVKATVSLSPVLIKQLDALANGARDAHWELSAKPAAQLSTDDKRFILRRFFDAPSSGAIAAHPRYQELLNKRGETPEQLASALQTFTEQDFRDLQMWFNLAWFDPDALAEPLLSELVARGRDFTEADKVTLFNKTLDVVRSVIPLHRDLQQAGQIEVITTPYAHPVLPLLTNTNLHKVSDSKATVPTPAFAFPQDAAEQIKRSVEVYQRHFGNAPSGLWPSEGAVASQLVKPVSEAGYRWMAGGERVLAKTLGMGEGGFARDGDVVAQAADQLYRPYVIETQDGAATVMVFGDQHLGELIGGEYSALGGEAAAQDFIDHLLRIRAGLEDSGAAGPHLISVILDGEGTWDDYADGGEAFLDALYRKLGEAEARGEIKTTTPGAYLAQFPDQQGLSDLSAGTQFDDGFSSWIGEPEENAAWGYLLRTRRFLDDYLTGKKPAEQRAIDQAYEAMLLAEGSDWLWRYGSDQDDGDDGYFDHGFRALLGRVYDALGVPQPEYVNVPIITPAIAAPAQMLQGVITPTIDGAVVEGEWDLAGAVRAEGIATIDSASPIAALYFGLSPKDFVLRADAAQEWNALAATGQPVRLGVYFKLPDVRTAAVLSRLGPEDVRRAPLGMPASHLLEWTLDPNGTASAALYAATDTGGWATVAAPTRARVASAATGQVLEMSVPLELMGSASSLRSDDSVQLVALVSQGGRVLGQSPANGIAQMIVP